MKKVLYGALAFSMLFTACEKANEITDPQQSINKLSLSKQTYIIRLADGFAEDALANISDFDTRNEVAKNKILELLSNKGIAGITIEQTFNTVFVGFSASLNSIEKAAISKLPLVADIAENGTVGIDATFAAMSTSAAQETPYGIARVGYASGAGKRAWILDTGIDLDHPDLNVNTSLSRTFLTGGYTGSPDDGHGHGTHVAGTIAAKNNNIGVIGVAYDAEVVAVQVLNAAGSGDIVGVVAGMDYVAAVGLPGDVANMSLSGDANSILDYAAISAAASGVYFALAAGNEHRDANLNSPARANGLNLFTVSAMDASDRFASFSNYGASVDFCAPGVSIKSCNKNGGYRYMSGTSMAAPHVAGLLLITNGNVQTDGYVTNDRDNNPDPIAHN
jgi:subtilisin family serine protease